MLEQFLLVGCSSVNYRSFCRLATSGSLVYASPPVEVFLQSLSLFLGVIRSVLLLPLTSSTSSCAPYFSCILFVHLQRKKYACGLEINGQLQRGNMKHEES